MPYDPEFLKTLKQDINPNTSLPKEDSDPINVKSQSSPSLVGFEQREGSVENYDTLQSGNIQYGTPDQLNQAQYENQGYFETLGKGALNIVPNIVLGIGEFVGYAADLESHIELFKGNGKEIDNAFSAKMRELREKNQSSFLGTGFSTEIYDDPNGLNFTNPKTWIEGINGIAESIIEFYATGFGIGTIARKGVQLAVSPIKQAVKLSSQGSKYLNAKKLADALKLQRQALDSEFKLSQTLNTIDNFGSNLAQGTTSVTTSYLEGIMNGVESFDRVKELVLSTPKEDGSSYTEEEANEIAGDAAASTVKLTTLFGSLLNYTSLAPIFRKGQTITSSATDRISSKVFNQLKEKGDIPEDLTITQWLKELKTNPDKYTKALTAWEKIIASESLPREMLQEGAEEYLQEVSSQYATVNASNQIGLKASIDFTSPEALFSFALGAIGGVFGKGLMKAIESQKDNETREEYAKRSFETVLDRRIEFLEKREKIFNDLKLAEKDNNKIGILNAKNEIETTLAVNAYLSNSVEELKDSLKEISSLPEETAKANGYDTSKTSTNYKTIADNALKNIDETEKILDIVFARKDLNDAQRRILANNLFKQQVIESAKEQIQKELSTAYSKSNPEYVKALIQTDKLDNNSKNLPTLTRDLDNAIINNAREIRNKLLAIDSIELSDITKEQQVQLNKIKSNLQRELKELVKDTNYNIDEVLDKVKVVAKDTELLAKHVEEIGLELEEEKLLKENKKYLDKKEIQKEQARVEKEKAKEEQEKKDSKDVDISLKEAEQIDIVEDELDKLENKKRMSNLINFYNKLRATEKVAESSTSKPLKSKTKERIKNLLKRKNLPEDIESFKTVIIQKNKDQLISMISPYEQLRRNLEFALEGSELVHWIDKFEAVNENEEFETPIKVIKDKQIIKINGYYIPHKSLKLFYEKNSDGTVTVYDESSRLPLFTTKEVLENTDQNLVKKLNDRLKRNPNFLYQKLSESYGYISFFSKVYKDKTKAARRIEQQKQLDNAESTSEGTTELKKDSKDNFINSLPVINEKPKPKKDWEIGKLLVKRKNEKGEVVYSAKWAHLKLGLEGYKELINYKAFTFFLYKRPDGKYQIIEASTRRPVGDPMPSVISAVKSAEIELNKKGGAGALMNRIEEFKKQFKEEKKIEAPTEKKEETKKSVIVDEAFVEEGDPTDSLMKDINTALAESLLQDDEALLSDPETHRGLVLESAQIFYNSVKDENRFKLFVELNYPKIDLNSPLSEEELITLFNASLEFASFDYELEMGKKMKKERVEEEKQSNIENDVETKESEKESKDITPIKEETSFEGPIKTSIGYYKTEDGKVIIENNSPVIDDKLYDGLKLDLTLLHDPNIQNAEVEFEFFENNWFKSQNFKGDKVWKMIPIVVTYNGGNVTLLEANHPSRRHIYESLMRGEKVTGELIKNEKGFTKGVTAKSALNTNKFTPIVSGKQGVSYQYYREEDEFVLRNGTPEVLIVTSESLLSNITDEIDKLNLESIGVNISELGQVYIGIRNPSGILIPLKASTAKLDNKSIIKVLELLEEGNSTKIDEIVSISSRPDNVGDPSLYFEIIPNKVIRYFSPKIGQLVQIELSNITENRDNYLMKKIVPDGKKMTVVSKEYISSESFKEDFTNFLKNKKFNVKFERLKTENYTSEITGITYPTYEEYLSNSKELDNTLNRPSILSTDLFNDNGNFFKDVTVTIDNLKVQKENKSEKLDEVPNTKTNEISTNDSSKLQKSKYRSTKLKPTDLSLKNIEDVDQNCNKQI